MNNHLGGFPVSEATATNRARDPLNGPGDLSINSPLSLISKDLKGEFILSLKVMIIIPVKNRHPRFIICKLLLYIIIPSIRPSQRQANFIASIAIGCFQLS